jgi:predicted acyltransferase
VNKQRYYSLDVFRGATVAFMILVNNPGSWQHLYSPLEHAKWHGITPTDLVFPFFLFAVGNAMAFVFPRLEQAGEAAFWKKIVTRTLLILAIGLFLNWFPFVQWQNDELVARGWTWQRQNGELAGVRILGVLQRIALAYFFASVIIHFAKARGAMIVGAILLILYWLLCLAGNPADPYSLEGWFGTNIDKAVLGEAHMYHGEGIAFDPEGLVSTLPSIVQVIIGFLAGDYIRRKGTDSLFQTLTVLFVAAVFLLFAAYCWQLTFPINKKIWTSSYVLLTSGLAMLLLCTLIYFVEIKNKRGAWSSFFEAFGKNALFIYALSGIFPKILSMIRLEGGRSAWSWYYDNVASKFPGRPENGSLLFAISFVVLLWAIAAWMNRRKIYIRV